VVEILVAGPAGRDARGHADDDEEGEKPIHADVAPEAG
jgi:hypothetical protein